jgi:hypothetical protein
MKLASGIGVGLLTFAGLCASPLAAQAQGIPQGSYLDTCTGARVEGDSLVARCHRSDGFERESALLNYRGCPGDIFNENGVLNCHFGAVAIPAPAPVTSSPIQRAAVWCNDLQREALELRDRLDRTFDPVEHAHLQGQLDVVDDQEDHCAQ